MNLHNAKIDRRPCFHIFNALLFDTTPRSARATYQTDGSLRHHWNFTTPATPGLRSGTESRLRRSIMIGRTGHGGAPLLLGRLTDRILCRMRFCARRATNVSDSAGYAVFNVHLSVCPSKPTLKADFDRKARPKARRKERGKGRAPVHTGGRVRLLA